MIYGSKPVQFLYNCKFGIEGNYDRVLFFVPMYDSKGVCDSNALGTGAGYLADPKVTETQWMAMLGDSPFQQFSWQINASINDVTELKRAYIWGPRRFMWEITNQELFPVFVHIYWAKPRRDMDYNAVAHVADSLDFTYGQDLNDVTARCLERDGFFTYGAGVLKSQLSVSWTPFESHTWCQLFKVRKVQKLRMDAGQCIKINHKKSRWRQINDTDVSTTEYVATRDMLIPFIHVVGCPVYDSTNINKVGTGKCRITIVHTSKFSWYTLNSNTQQKINVDLPAPAGGITQANARYISKPVAGAVAAI